MDAVLTSHTRVLPGRANDELGRAVDRAMGEVLGSSAGRLKHLINARFRPSWAAVPRAEGMVLWLRSHLPQYAGQILNRARRYYNGYYSS